MQPAPLPPTPDAPPRPDGLIRALRLAGGLALCALTVGAFVLGEGTSVLLAHLAVPTAGAAIATLGPARLTATRRAVLGWAATAWVATLVLVVAFFVSVWPDL